MAKDEYYVHGIKLHKETIQQLQEIADEAGISLENLIKRIEKVEPLPPKKRSS